MVGLFLVMQLELRSSSFAMGVDRSDKPFRGFLPMKTTPRDLYRTIVIAKLLSTDLEKLEPLHRTDSEVAAQVRSDRNCQTDEYQTECAQD